MTQYLHNGIAIPERLVRNVAAWSDPTMIADGWLDTVADTVAEFEERWQITWDGLPPDSAITLVLLGNSARLGPVAFKSAPIGFEFLAEARALEIAGGDHVSRLLHLDVERSAMLVERIVPGTQLRDAGLDDAEATHIHAHSALAFQRVVDGHRDLIPLRSWMRDLLEWNPARHPVPEPFVRRAQAMGERLLATADRTVLLHGDLQHHNILAGPNGWHVIDPKGVIGDPGFEFAAWTYNPPGVAHADDYVALTRARIAIVAGNCDISPERLLEWAFVGNVLSTIWSSEGEAGAWHGDGLRIIEFLGGMLSAD